MLLLLQSRQQTVLNSLNEDPVRGASWIVPMARPTSRRLSRIFRPLFEAADVLQESRQSKAFQNRRPRRRLRRSLGKLVALRTLAPPIVLVTLSLVGADVAQSWVQHPLEAAAGGAGVLSKALAGLQISHLLDESVLELTGGKVALFDMAAWTVGLGTASYLTALYLTWMRAKWARSLAILSLAPVAYWVVPLILICVLAAAASTSLLNERVDVPFLLVCALPTLCLLVSTDHFGGWIRQQNWLPYWCQLGLGAPALFGWAGVLFFGFVSWSTSEEQLEVAYYQAHSNSARRQADFGAGTSGDRFRAILVLSESEPQTALEEMRSLADGTDYAMAHLWLADIGMQSGDYVANTKQTDELLAHLDMGLQHDRHDADVWPEVTRVHRRVKKSAAEIRMQRAWQLSARGKVDAALRESQHAIGHYVDLVKQATQAIEFPLELSKCWFFVEDYASGLRVLEEAKARNPVEAFDWAISQFYIAWYDELTHRSRHRLQARMGLLLRALSHDCDQASLLSRLATLATESSGPLRDRAVQILKSVKQQGSLPAGVHFVLGGLAVEKEDLRTAIWHYEQVNAQQANQPAVLNNLAWCLASIDEPDLKRALMLADRAIQIAPDKMAYRETRGQILAQLHRWKEAITELERALHEMPGHTPIHLTLARAYQEVGLPALSATHRRFATDDATRE